MVTPRKRSGTLETSATPKSINDEIPQTPVEDYEQSREKRIKENMERMHKLGIFDISLKLKPTTPNPRKTFHPKTPLNLPPIPSSVPSRRSSRLHNVTPVSYSEVDVPKKTSKNENVFVLEEGSKPEVYTEEHAKLLGDCMMSWTLFVDGCGKDGRRIYDQIRGKTCHQCRQKTLGHRTHCSSCNLVQGQFCGDCLYMRYGEHVLEANQNPSWVCPVCRGICNCSLCRLKKGWAPTGSLYRKICNLGFKSVAHYLIQTRCSDTNSEKDTCNDNAVSTRRSLQFPDADVPSEKNQHESEDKTMTEAKAQEVNVVVVESGPKAKKMPPQATKAQTKTETKAQTKTLTKDEESSPEAEKTPARATKAQTKTETKGEESSPVLKKKASRATEPSPDSIGGRLRLRRSGGK